MADTALLLSLAAAFAIYAVLHSLLASAAVKRWVERLWPSLVPFYRLAYNLFAVLLLLPVAWLLWQWQGETIWIRPLPLRLLFDGLALAALAAFVHSLGSYDLASFSGTRQWRARHADRPPVDGVEVFRIGFWHRFVRHPWYFFSLVILWTRDMNAATLLFFSLITLYLMIGSRLEERKLVANFGEAYRRYRAQVPGLVPLPWRWLSAKQAADLQLQASNSGASDS